MEKHPTVGKRIVKMENKKEVCQFLERDKTLIAHINTDLDSHTARRVREAIDGRMFLARPEAVVLDFGAVSFMDSSGLALILGRAEVARAIGCTVRLAGLSPLQRRLVRLGGLDRIENISIIDGEPR
jgi:stage II sporulation protein AA (anti-sigma F factor antagonist)